MKKRLAVIGSTETTGAFALQTISQYPELFKVEALSTNDKADLIISQANKLQPNVVIVTEQKAFDKVKNALSNTDIKVYFGDAAIIDILSWDTIDMIVLTTLGFGSLSLILAALDAGKPIAVANNEVMAGGGALIRQKLLEKNGVLIPINPSLSSIFQGLIGEDKTKVREITLMASGGPFFEKKTNFLVNVKRDHALQTPSHLMEEKSMVDEATLMNKGLETLIIHALYDYPGDQIHVLIHPESVLHSMVGFIDGTLKALVGDPEITSSLLYALSFPTRLGHEAKSFNFKKYSKLTFAEPDYKTFLGLNLAQKAMETGGNAPCVLNAANEVVVDAFLHNRIGFLEMYDMIGEALNKITFIAQPGLEDLEKTDRETRILTQSLTKNSQLYN